MTPTAADLRALQVLADADKPLRCTELGERLWGRPAGRRKRRQSYALAAGKVLKRLMRADLVCERATAFCSVNDHEPRTYTILSEGRRVLESDMVATKPHPGIALEKSVVRVIQSLYASQQARKKRTRQSRDSNQEK